MLSFTTVAITCLIYMLALVAIAYSTEKNEFLRRQAHHPIIYIFSLGIFASAWSFYGVIDLARDFGYGALAYYAGTGILFLFAPLALKPMLELARRFQVNSLADLLVFRYNSHFVGAVVTFCMLVSMGPLLALQLQAVADTIYITHSTGLELSTEPSSGQIEQRELFALIYCILVAIFTMLFGSNQNHNKGLITAMAFESLIKLMAISIIGGVALFSVLGGFNGIESWLQQHPEYIEQLHSPNRSDPPHILLLVFVATAVVMPHIFHLTVVEHPETDTTHTISWVMPLFILFLALPIFPILWAGQALEANVAPQYYSLGIPIALGSHTLTLIAFVGGLSAATGALIAITLSLTTMILNHWILPSTKLGIKDNVYQQLVWMRRILIAIVLLFGYGFYWLIGEQLSLTEMALIAFIATLQFLPGVAAVTHWSRGSLWGFFAGLAVGFSIWAVGLFVPMLADISKLSLPFFDASFDVGIKEWSRIAQWSLGLNILTFISVSLLTQQSQEERYSAELCADDELSHPIRMVLDIRSPEEIIERLSKRIGTSTAESEVERALTKLGLGPGERRPYALRRLRDEIEANLSGLMGISMASEIMDRLIPYRLPETHVATDINLIESRLNEYRNHLTGLAADLNKLRLYHRRTLEGLPLAVCSIGEDMEVLMWNSAMTALTGIDDYEVTGSLLDDVEAPWGEILRDFADSDQTRSYKRAIELKERTHWISLYKSAIDTTFSNTSSARQVILLEDVTELQLLEQELIHSERLASIGRLAAGVAHEIGNPITGIACLAQNMRDETQDSELLRTVEQILSLTQRVDRIVQSLVSFSHADQLGDRTFEPVQLQECAQEAIDLLSLQKEKQPVHFDNTLDSSVRVLGDSQRLIQVFINLLSNSRDASPADGHIVIAGHPQNGKVVFSVTDEGPGIPQDIIGRIFEPFFTTKDPGEGTGLGLAMVYSIIEEHNGNLAIVSPADPIKENGTRFVITLPEAR